MMKRWAVAATILGLLCVQTGTASASGTVDALLRARARVGGEIMDTRTATVAADVTGNSRRELVVLWTGARGNGFTQYLSVLTGSGRRWALKANEVVGGRCGNSWDTIVVERQLIRIDGWTMGDVCADDGNEQPISSLYRVVGSELIQVEQP